MIEMKPERTALTVWSYENTTYW